MVDISVITKKISNLKSQVAREQGQLEGLKQRQQLLVAQLKELNITPDTLVSYIESKEQELETLSTDLANSLSDIETKRQEILDGIQK
jgi:chromosome segregation ATPase